jgi:hypothetical protein
MRASQPTARAALSIPQARTTPLDPLAPRLRLLCGLDSADPFVSGQRRDIVPSRSRSWIELQCVFQVAWKCMDETASDVCLVSHQKHRTQSFRHSVSAFITLGQRVGNKSTSMAMAHAVRLLEPVHMLYVLGRGVRAAAPSTWRYGAHTTSRWNGSRRKGH